MTDLIAVGISLISAAGAVTAVVIAKRALDYSKGEPLRAAQRALNEDLRVKVNDLLEEAHGVEYALRSGANIPEEKGALEEARKFFRDLKRRRPDRSDSVRHRLTGALLDALWVEWRGAVYQQETADGYQAELEEASENESEGLTQITSKWTAAKRSRDARYLDLKDKVKEAREQLEQELFFINRLDRGED